ncbi:MAG: RidA family protein [Pirellulales bacterium]
MMSADEVFSSLALELPPAAKPAGLYQPCLIHQGHAYVSGHGPLQPDGSLITGKIGQDLDSEQGKEAARQVGLSILSTLVSHLGSLDRVNRVIKIFGMVNATDDFSDHPIIINGCSELFRSVWGADQGVGVRSAIGVASLPSNMAVEIEAMFELS